MLAPVVSANFWLEFPGFQDPKDPFHDKRVRQAVSLTIDRTAINQAECDGLGVVDGNWINDDVEYGMPWPIWEHNIAKAKELMAQSGHPRGFDVASVTRSLTIFHGASASSRSCGLSASAPGCRPWSAASF
jgi:ABC-type transport system substrate-binding protein